MKESLYRVDEIPSLEDMKKVDNYMREDVTQEDFVEEFYSELGQRVSQENDYGDSEDDFNIMEENTETILLEAWGAALGGGVFAALTNGDPTATGVGAATGYALAKGTGKLGRHTSHTYRQRK